MPFGKLGLGLLSLVGAGSASNAVGAITALFANSENGAWLAPDNAASVWRDGGGTLPARLDGNVRLVSDLSGNDHAATPTATTSVIRYFEETLAGKRFIRVEPGGAAALRLDFGSSLGADCTIVFANAASIEFREGQTVGSTYDITKSFFQFLIIDRALTVDEKAAVIEYFAPFCPHYAAESDYDRFVDAVSGNDTTGDGLTRGTAWATMTKALAMSSASASGLKICVLPGTYTAGISANDAKTHTWYFPEAGVVMDLSESPTGSGSSGFNAESNAVINIFADGNFHVTNLGNNGVSCNAGVINVHDLRVSVCNDGFSTHGLSGGINSYRCFMRGGTKTAFAHTGNGPLAYDEFSVYYGKLDATLALGLAGEKGTNFDFLGSDFLPDPLTTSVWTKFSIQNNDAGAGAATTRKFRRCRFGAPHITPGSTDLATLWNTEITDCYFNGIPFHPASANASTSIVLRCFGPKFGYRCRRTAIVVLNIDNCAFTGGAVATATRLLNADFYSSPGDICAAGRIRNSILKGASTAIFVTGTAVADVNTNWSFQNNCFHGNTTNYSSGVTADGTDVLADPQLVAPTSDEKEDWYVASGSPCVAAGTGGGNIGIGVAA